jgi:hypothetical protein
MALHPRTPGARSGYRGAKNVVAEVGKLRTEVAAAAGSIAGFEKLR